MPPAEVRTTGAASRIGLSWPTAADIEDPDFLGQPGRRPRGAPHRQGQPPRRGVAGNSRRAATRGSRTTMRSSCSRKPARRSCRSTTRPLPALRQPSAGQAPDGNPPAAGIRPPKTRNGPDSHSEACGACQPASRHDRTVGQPCHTRPILPAVAAMACSHHNIFGLALPDCGTSAWQGRGHSARPVGRPTANLLAYEHAPGRRTKS